MADCIVLHPQDNVATVLRKAAGRDVLVIADQNLKETGRITALEEIPFAHKISLRDIQKGEKIIKYGECIGKASAEIAQGKYVHIHNVISIEGAEKIVTEDTGKQGG